MNRKFLSLLTAAAICFTGCEAKVTEADADKEVLELVEKYGYEIDGFSEVALATLYTMDVHDFLGMYGASKNEGALETYIQNRMWLTEEYGFDNEENMKIALNAELEDFLHMYTVGKAVVNAEAVTDLADKYLLMCQVNNIAVESYEYTGKIKAQAPSDEVHFDGTEDDVILFIQKYITDEARNGYFYFEINDEDGVIDAYWSADKALLNEDNFKDEYEWTIKDIADGKPIIGSAFSDYTYCGTSLFTVGNAQNGILATDEDDFYSNYWNSPYSDYYMYVSENEAIENNTKDIADKFNFLNPDDIGAANNNASHIWKTYKEILYDYLPEKYDSRKKWYFGNDTEDNSPVIFINGEDITAEVPLDDYLEPDPGGYYYCPVSTSSFQYHLCLWSEKPIPDKYKLPYDELIVLFTEEEQLNAAKEGNLIGIHPTPYFYSKY